MINLRTIVQTEGAQKKLAKVQAALQQDRIDRVVERVALKSLRSVVMATPKRWNVSQIRRTWKVEKPEMGARLVKNDNKVMLYLEEGTADKGTGWITPKKKKFLFVPLRKEAAMGWHKGLKLGVDYLLKKKVHGIKPRKIAAAEAKKAQEALYKAMVEHIEKALK